MPTLNETIDENIYIDPEKAAIAEESIPPEDTVLSLAETFKVLSDPTRLKIVLALSAQELCVFDLASMLHVTNSAISHQLRLLRNLRLVKYRRDARLVYYSLDDQHIENLIRECLEHVKENTK